MHCPLKLAFILRESYLPFILLQPYLTQQRLCPWKLALILSESYLPFILLQPYLTKQYLCPLKLDLTLHESYCLHLASSSNMSHFSLANGFLAWCCLTSLVMMHFVMTTSYYWLIYVL